MAYMRKEWKMSNAQIAKEMRCSIATVHKRLGDQPQSVTDAANAERVRKIREALAKALTERKAKYVPIMLGLRRKGFSNKDIAAETGFCIATVARYIGNNPDEIRLACVRIGAMKRKLRNDAVRRMAHDDAIQIITTKNSESEAQAV